MVIQPKRNVVVAIYGVRHFLMVFRPKQNVVVAIYGTLPLTYNISPKTKRSSDYLWRYAAFLS